MMSGDPTGIDPQISASNPVSAANNAAATPWPGEVPPLEEPKVTRPAGPLAARLSSESNDQAATSEAPRGTAVSTNPSAVSTMSAAERAADLAASDTESVGGSGLRQKGRDGGSRGSDRGNREGGNREGRGRGNKGPPRGDREDRAAAPSFERAKISVPNVRGPLDDDLQADLDAAMSAADIESLMNKDSVVVTAAPADGQRMRGTVIKVHDDNVFVALGGPYEGYVSEVQFTEAPPEPGSVIEVVVRGFNKEDGLYQLLVPGQSVQVEDWSDLEVGTVVQVVVTGVNTGGLEVKVGNADGFMPAGQVAEHRVEDFSDYVGQRLTCIIVEASESRRRLIVSHRAILERQREEKRLEQLAKLQIGDTMEGIVRTIKDFGAFVDMGGLEGLIHISRMSWDRIKHPSEVMEVGQRVKVVIEKIDAETGKIGLSYRDLLDHPWDGAAAKYPVGATVRGTVTRLAAFGAFVKIATGVEGLVHVSELAHHRVFKVDNVVKEGDEVEVKVLSIDTESQKISLSLKATQAKPMTEKEKQEALADAEAENAPPQEPAVKRQHDGPLKGGMDRPAGGESFGLKW